MIALPSLHLTEKGSLPGNEFGVCNVKAVRGGEVKRVFSLGRGTKAWGPSSMTQLVLLARGHFQRVLWWWYTDLMDILASRSRVRLLGALGARLARKNPEIFRQQGRRNSCGLDLQEVTGALAVCRLLYILGVGLLEAFGGRCSGAALSAHHAAR